MSNEKINKKIETLRKKIENFITKSDGDMEEVHKIRTSSREVLSLLNEQKLHCLDLKKVLKLSNKIRDIDVLISEYLTNIPASYQEKINILLIKDILSEERQKELSVFLNYLKQFSNQNIEFLEKQYDLKDVDTRPILSFDIKQLHKYRIFIKNQLYIAKNSEFENKDKIKLLTQIKDLLGNINDNHNALKIIKSISKDKFNIKELKKFTKEQNINNYKKVKTLVVQLEKHL